MNTKQEYMEYAKKLLDPLKPLYTARKTGIHVGDTAAWYDEGAARLESFARPLWGLAAFWSGGGEDAVFEEIYREGLCHGTDPEDPEYWNEPGPCDQRFVEMSVLAYTILLARDKIWDPLSEQQKEKVAGYLYKINEYPQCPSNWQFFNVLTNLALKSVGCRYSPQRMEEALEMIDSLYIGDGWYQDGTDGTMDYYIPFAFHYYGLLYSVFAQKDDPERCERFRQRACTFARDFIYWFAEDGSAVPYGRSQTYRFAQAAFWSACVFADVSPFPMGVMKGIISRHLEYWQGTAMADRDGLLTIGYHYPNLLMAEHYNAPGSPYWALKTMLVLVLPGEHPFWSAECEQLPELETKHKIEAAQMLVARNGGNVTLYVPGIYKNEALGHTDCKYAKFAYSSLFGFNVSYSNFMLSEAAPDSMLAFELSDRIYQKRKIDHFEVKENEISIDWSPVPGIWVKTVIRPFLGGHERLHTVESDYDCKAYDCGFAVAWGADAAFSEGKDFAEAANSFSKCKVTDLTGEGTPGLVDASPNTNLLYPSTRIPRICYLIQKGTNTVWTRIEAGK